MMDKIIDCQKDVLTESFITLAKLQNQILTTKDLARLGARGAETYNS